MTRIDRRRFMAGTAAVVASRSLVARAAEPVAEIKKPRERPHVLYALSTGSWGRVIRPGEPLPLLKILDETAAAGFNGVRLTGWPNILEQNHLSAEQYGEELEKRGLRFSTISFGGQYYDRGQQSEILARARDALALHQRFGATAGVFFPPSPVKPAEEADAFREMFRFVDRMGKMALEAYGVRFGLHNHTDTLVENQAQVDRYLEGTNPDYVFCAWDTAHLHVGGCDVQATFRKSLDRIVYTDFKDATRKPVADDYLSPNGERFAGDSHSGKFFNSMLELGRGEIDFVALMKMLAEKKYAGWINHDLDTIRVSIAESWRVSMDYVREKLDPIWA
ncbi:MAG: sugar phosphate isomerase/epimerase [Pirellulales bacterium]|nr:sugar phosphate isomerase/epimerase [Pirellulales bacterium]